LNQFDAYHLGKTGGVTLTQVFSKENRTLSSFMHTGPSLAASPSLLPKLAHNKRQFEKVKNCHRLVTDKVDHIMLYRQLSSVKCIGINKDNGELSLSRTSHGIMLFI
jgi:hypothetical protein